MKPYFEDGNITIYHADAREILPSLSKVGLLLTDPPFGVEDGNSHHRRPKVEYGSSQWRDTSEYVLEVVIPLVRAALGLAERGIVTPGSKHLYDYPRPIGIGAFYHSRPGGFKIWGSHNLTPILYYGKDPRSGRSERGGPWPVARVSHIRGIDRGVHPNARPLEDWQWLLQKGSVEPSEVVLDPFMGSGTTLRAAKNLGRPAVGIEIEEEFCERAANRLRQEVLPI